ncbi:MAG: MBL fold metallo-hydrolase, partial [Candidatus Aminicenantes bacterium]|nr:MBL fold metallo-hydrolase [Candidatus Aminicenantes bacterium]
LSDMEQALANFEVMRALSTLADEQKLKQVDSIRKTLEVMWDSTNSCRDSRAIEFGVNRLDVEEFSVERAARKREEMYQRMKAHYTYFQGNILFQLSRIPEASRCYEEAVKLNPLHADAHNNLIAIAYLGRQYEKAQALLEKAEEQGLDENLNLELKERLFKALGRPTEGILQEDLSVGGSDRLDIRRFALAFRPEQPLAQRLYVNAYIVFSPRTKEAVLIDPGVKDQRLEEFVRDRGLAVKAILNTHDHSDHTGANAIYAKLFGAPVYAPKDDARFYDIPPDRVLKGGEVLAFDGLTIGVLRTPGHTDGSLCFLAGGALFSGDSLFKGDIGKVWTDKPEKRAAVRKKLVQAIRDKILTLPEQTLICPGHGKTSTVGAEKTSNPALTK